MKCKCGKDIPAARLAALPNTSCCVECSTEEQVRGAMIWEHKTAPELELQSPAKNEQFKRFANRRTANAFLPLASPNNPFFKNSRPGTAWEHDATRAVLKDEPVVEGASANLVAARCHPGRPQVGPSRLCAECAVLWYQKRAR